MSLSMNVYLMSSTTTRHSQLKKIRILNFTPSPQIDFTRKATPAHSVVTASGGLKGPPNHPKPFSHHALCSTPGHLAPEHRPTSNSAVPHMLHRPKSSSASNNFPANLKPVNSTIWGVGTVQRPNFQVWYLDPSLKPSSPSSPGIEPWPRSKPPWETSVTKCQ